MKFLDDAERKRLEEEFLQQYMNHPVSTSNWNNSSSSTPYFTSRPMMSPTDVDAKGKFEYQEPEVDEQGTYYGYKILNEYHNPSAGLHRLVSPRFNVMWNHDGCLTADRCPDEHHMHGIHFTKRPDHPELNNYVSYSEPYWMEKEKRSVLVKCALSGTVVHTEQGFRAEHAQIVGVYTNGYWTSHQDYKERSRTDSGRNPSQEWEYRKSFNPYSGNYTYNNTYFDPSADS